MREMRHAALGAMLLIGGMIASTAHSAALDSSLRPLARTIPTAAQLAEPSQTQRPRLRPPSEQDHAQRSAQILVASAAIAPLPSSLRPATRNPDFAQKAMSKRKREERKERRANRKASKSGGVCGDPKIKGTQVGSVPGRIRGCGVKQAVRITSVSGVALSTGAVMDCGTAKALRKWVDTGVKPAVGKRGGGVASLKVAAHYACRTRNNRKGAKISEHGKGRAIDISAITMRDGSQITVLKGWRSKRDRTALKRMHKAACGPFGTVLGPDADRYHQDHFHFDTARYRSGSYCK